MAAHKVKIIMYVYNIQKLLYRSAKKGRKEGLTVGHIYTFTPSYNAKGPIYSFNIKG